MNKSLKQNSMGVQLLLAHWGVAEPAPDCSWLLMQTLLRHKGGSQGVSAIPVGGRMKLLAPRFSLLSNDHRGRQRSVTAGGCSLILSLFFQINY